MSPQRRYARPIWFPQLTLRGGIFLGGGGALFLNALVINRRDLLFVAFLLIAVPVAALCYVTLRPARLHVTRTFRPPIVPAGGDVVVSLQVRNLSMRPLYGTRWRDTASEGIKPPASALLPMLNRYDGGPGGGGDTATLEYTLTPRLRGVYDVGPMVLGRHDPFGLAFSERPVGEPHDLVVTPRVIPLTERGVMVTSGDGAVHEILRHINPNSDELIAREYRPGDPLRRVNWPATARHGEIMVRQEEQRSTPEAVLILDTTLSGRPAYSATHVSNRMRRHDAAFELAIEIAASVGTHLLAEGFRLNVLELGRSQLAPGPDRERGGLHGDAPSTFLATGGDRLLLEGLANLVPIDRSRPDAGKNAAPRRSARASSAPTPAFAILVDIDAADAKDLAAARGNAEPAVAFVLDTVKHAILGELEDAGWRCITVRGARDIPAAWNQLLNQRGAVHDLA
jgi:uncharacterized protein (DUF58 family)